LRSELAKAFSELTEHRVRSTRLNRDELAYLVEKLSGKSYTEFLSKEDSKMKMHIDLGKRISKPKLDMPNWLKS